MTTEDPERSLFPLRVQSDRIIDLRDPLAFKLYDNDVPHRAAHWQKIRAQGLRSPTWDISDRVRVCLRWGFTVCSIPRAVIQAKHI